VTDRELLELAAKAAGVDYHIDHLDGIPKMVSDGHVWNPLVWDGQALRLAARLKLNIMQGEFSVAVGDEGDVDEAAFVPDESQRLYGIREAIVRAAAEIGRAMG
jgi:hypothetical protein